MKRFILSLGLGLLAGYSAKAADYCFIAAENYKVIKQAGDNCSLRQAPCSTFKIALSLMGYNEGILKDETHPEFPFKKGYVDWLERWKQPHNPQLWMKNSCVWYSQVLTKKLGMKKYKEYAVKFNYGNADVSGDKGKNNGLSRAWLSSSLQISPEEQIKFLQKLIDYKLPVSKKANEMTRKILFVEKLADGWKLYGKTGNGSQQRADGSKIKDRQVGWFVGWISKGKRHIVFVYRILDKNKQNTYASLRAKAAARKELLKIIREQSGKQ
ncbi:class D beta-lactamase [Lentisphaerota bacterium ZTH]|nr:class D beta-lactamase [Lentisphaerota bacterium]WET05362.1 class D beta-lactamase [Lentisphaerota bacterium ZTH]